MSPADDKRAGVALFRSDIKNVHVEFADGTEVDGFVKRIGGDQPVLLNKHSVLRNEDPLVVLDFGRVARIEIEFYDGTSQAFP